MPRSDHKSGKRERRKKLRHSRFPALENANVTPSSYHIIRLPSSNRLSRERSQDPAMTHRRRRNRRVPSMGCTRIADPGRPRHGLCRVPITRHESRLQAPAIRRSRARTSRAAASRPRSAGRAIAVAFRMEGETRVGRGERRRTARPCPADGRGTHGARNAEKVVLLRTPRRLQWRISNLPRGESAGSRSLGRRRYLAKVPRRIGERGIAL